MYPFSLKQQNFSIYGHLKNPVFSSVHCVSWPLTFIHPWDECEVVMESLLLKLPNLATATAVWGILLSINF